MDVEAGAALGWFSKTSAVILVWCDGLRLAYWQASLALHHLHRGLPSLGVRTGPLKWQLSTCCRQSSCVLVSRLAPQPPRQAGRQCFSTGVLRWGCRRGSGRPLLGCGYCVSSLGGCAAIAKDQHRRSDEINNGSPLAR